MGFETNKSRNQRFRGKINYEAIPMGFETYTPLCHCDKDPILWSYPYGIWNYDYDRRKKYKIDQISFKTPPNRHLLNRFYLQYFQKSKKFASVAKEGGWSSKSDGGSRTRNHRYSLSRRNFGYHIASSSPIGKR